MAKHTLTILRCEHRNIVKVCLAILQHTLTILRCEHRNTVKVCLAILQHYA